MQTLAGVTGLDVEALSMTSGRILPPLALILPFWLVKSMVPWRETFAVWPALLAVGGAFAGTQFAWSNFVGFELVDLASSIASLLAGVILLRFWKPKDEWRFEHDKPAVAIASGITDVIDGAADVQGHGRDEARPVVPGVGVGLLEAVVDFEHHVGDVRPGVPAERQ